MKRGWLLPMFLGLLVGVGLGVSGWLWFNAFLDRRGEQPSVTLSTFEFNKLAAATGHPNWQVIEDRTRDASNSPQYRNGRATRCIVATVEIPAKDQGLVASKLQTGLQNWIGQTCRVSGTGGSSTSGSKSHDGRTMAYYRAFNHISYSDDSKDGTVDLCIIAYDGLITVTLHWAE